MKFSNGQAYSALYIVFVLRTTEEMEAREEYNSLLCELQIKDSPKKGVNMYSILAREIKIGESIFDKKTRAFICYRVE